MCSNGHEFNVNIHRTVLLLLPQREIRPQEHIAIFGNKYFFGGDCFLSLQPGKEKHLTRLFANVAEKIEEKIVFSYFLLWCALITSHYFRNHLLQKCR